MGVNNDKRAFKRFSKEFSIRVSKKDPEKSVTEIISYHGKAINISGSGLFLNLDQTVETGDTIKLTFLKPNTFYFFDGPGRVVRIGESDNSTWDIGIEFTDISQQDARMLDYYLQQQR